MAQTFDDLKLMLTDAPALCFIRVFKIHQIFYCPEGYFYSRVQRDIMGKWQAQVN